MSQDCVQVSIRAEVRLADVDPNGWQILEKTGVSEFWCSCGQAARGKSEAVEQMAEPHLQRAVRARPQN
ncbi:hypothetical protein ACWDA3_26015 [Nonomuraea rubra]